VVTTAQKMNHKAANVLAWSCVPSLWCYYCFWTT